MQLVHYTDRPMETIHSIPPDEQTKFFKPKGLWVSIVGPDDWKSWCESEEFGLDRFKMAYEIKLSATARIRRIKTIAQLDAFTKTYVSPSVLGLTLGYEIEWKRLALRYDGIIIAPYQWRRRLHDGCSWYYAWDCASGCIWNASAVETITPIPVDL